MRAETTDQKFTTAAIKLLSATKEMCEWGEEMGLLDVEKVRLTIAARKEKAKELVDAGMSQRQAAKVLGVDEKTIRNAVRKESAESAEKFRTPEPDEESGNDDSTRDAEHDEGLRVIAARGFLNRAVEAKKICTIDKLRAPDITEAMVEAAYDAAAAWGEAARNLREMMSHA